MVEIIIALGIALVLKSVLDKKLQAQVPPVAEVQSALTAPTRKRLAIEGTGSAPVRLKEFALHAIPREEVNDALCVEGPVSLAELPPQAWLVLEDCQKAGNVRGPRLADFLAGRRHLGHKERLVFVLLDSALLGPRVVAFVSTADYYPVAKS